MKPSPCLHCGTMLDAATSVTDLENKPDPGDATICFRCGHLMVFAEDLSLRGLTAKEMYEIAGDPILIHAQRLRAAYWAEQDNEGS